MWILCDGFVVDLVGWTVTPVDDLVDAEGRTVTVSSVIVGTDRVVLGITFDAQQAALADVVADSVTLVGTPTRS